MRPTILRSAAGHLRPARQARLFHASRPAAVNVGDRIPDVELDEDAPGAKVKLATELSKGGILIGVPGAFTPTCSDTHIPGYINSPKLKSVDGPVFVVAVNDAFVTKAWADKLDPGRKSGIRFLADPGLVLTKALGLETDVAKSAFGTPRSSRYALVIKDGKVAQSFVEPDKLGLSVSAADNVL